MITSEIKNLTRKRRKWVQVNLENNFDIESILSGMYNDPSHFIYEILQNTEDACGKCIKFILNRDNLKIEHNGKDFDLTDVEGITGIGKSPKKDDLNKIGKFGVGFKSVYAITKSPEIKSGYYHFRIQDFVVPKILSDVRLIGKTEIILPFDHAKRTKSNIYKLVEDKFQNIGHKTLLFLSNIKEIRWISSSFKGLYWKEEKKLKSIANTKRIRISSSINNLCTFEDYLIISRPFKLSNKLLKVEVAYKLDINESDEEEFFPVTENESNLFVFFKTEKPTYLNFIIQGPYKTTSNRENIPLEDEQNDLILQETASLVAESMSTVKTLGKFNIKFMETLPISPEYCDQKIYSIIFNKVKEKFLSKEKLLPTLYNGYAHPKDSLLLSAKILPKFLNQKDIKFLYGKSHWLSADINTKKARKLREYINSELGVRIIDLESFADQIDEKFMRTKSDQWVSILYKKLIDNKGLWRKRSSWQEPGILRQKPIIRLQNNTHIAPFDSNDRVQAYLPTKLRSNYKVVKKSLVKDKKVLKILKELGLSEPDLFSEIDKFILPKYRLENINIKESEYFEDFERIIIALNSDVKDKKEQLISDLQKLKFIKSNRYNLTYKYFKRPEDIYINDENLLEYFKNYEDVFFVDGNMYRKFSSLRLDTFLIQIGCLSAPKRIEFSPTLTWEEKNYLRGDSGYTRDLNLVDYDLEGLDNFMDELTPIRSSILWNILHNIILNLDKDMRDTFFKGKYSWKYFQSHSREFDSKFLWTLKSNSWIYDKTGCNQFARDISVSDLADFYFVDNELIDFLSRLLEFKPKEIESIEQKYEGKFISNQEYEEYQFLKNQKVTEEERLDGQNEAEEWEPAVNPDLPDPRIEEIKPTEIERIIPTQNINEVELRESKIGDDEDGILNNSPEEPDTKSKNIGRWGEEFVFNYLKNALCNDYKIKETNLGLKIYKPNSISIEIKWLNKNKDVGKGCDIILLSDDRESEFIEVKSTIDEEKRYYEITGTQWELARQLFNKGEGDKYKIFIVLNSGKASARIKTVANPVYLWNTGKLFAHPVRFKI